MIKLIFRLSAKWEHVVTTRRHVAEALILIYDSDWKKVKVFTHLKEVRITKGCAQAEDVVSFWVFRNGLHDGAINDNQVLGRCLDRASFSRIARIKEQSRAFQTHPIALPPSFACQLYLVFLAKQPFLDTQDPKQDDNYTGNVRVTKQWGALA